VTVEVRERMNARVQVAPLFMLFVPSLVVALMQMFRVGLALSLGSDLQFSDSAGWAACASTTAELTTSEVVDWCARRPLGFLINSLLFVMSPNSLAGAVLLQTAVVSVVLAVFLRRLAATYRLAPLTLWAITVVLSWMTVSYGISLGPEALALLLSAVAATAFLRSLEAPSAANAVVMTTGLMAAFAVRPGNPLLLAVVIALAVVALRRRRLPITKVLLPLAPVVAIAGLLNRILRLTFLPDAGHGANFWATVYSAADPDAAGWPDTYRVFAAEASKLGPETLDFASFLRGEALEAVVAHPAELVLTVVKNFGYFIARGWITLFSGFPLRLRSVAQLRDIATGDRPVLVRSNIGLVVVAAVGGVLIVTSLYLAVRMARAFARQVSGQRRGDGLRSWVRAIPAAIAEQGPTASGVTVGCASVFGAFAFFGLVGHDEPYRHLVMSVPWAIIGVAAVLARQPAPPDSEPVAEPVRHAMSRHNWMAVGVVMLGLVLVVARVDAAHHPVQIAIANECSGGPTEAWRVVGAEPMGAAGTLDTGVDWRRMRVDEARLLDSAEFMEEGILQMRGGTLLALRNTDSGEIKNVWSPDAATSALEADGVSAFTVDPDSSRAELWGVLTACSR
jgi:hypothetical protein